MPDPAAPQPEAASSPEKPPKTALRSLRDWVVSFAIAIAVLAPIRSSLADWNDVPSGSMRPTILEGERIFVNKLAYGLRVPFTHRWIAQWSSPKRGDVITFASPADGIRLVKRVVGLPGDTVSMTNNVLTINGERLTGELLGPGDPTRVEGGLVNNNLFKENLPGRPHTIMVSIGVNSMSTFPETKIPEGKVWVMGDNRDLSRDSRYVGPVALDQIYGRSGVVVFSVDPQRSYWPRWSRWFKSIE